MISSVCQFNSVLPSSLSPPRKMLSALCHLGASACAPLRSLRHPRAAAQCRLRPMSGLAAAPTGTAAPPPPLPALPAPTAAPPVAPPSLEFMLMQQMQLLMAELTRKDLASNAEREAMRAEARAASAERERKDLAASAEREKAADEKEAAWEAKTMVLQHKLDLSTGAVRARSLYNVCIRDIAKRVAMDKQLQSRKPTATGVQTMLLTGPFCPALRAYICAVAVANNFDPAEVLRQANSMYGALSDPLHSEQDMQLQLPTALFDRDKGEEALIAFAAVVRFSGRNPSLYAQSGRTVVLVLPTPPRSCTATAKEARAAAAAGTAAAAAAAKARTPEKVLVSVGILDEGRAPLVEAEEEDEVE